MRCAAIHRKLGTHISKVKSLSMDAWSSEQVEVGVLDTTTGRRTNLVKVMKSTGNTASNRIYNPRNVKPSIPIDVDEVDGVLERFIRQKYEHKTLAAGVQPASRQHTGSTGSSEDRAAPLPPKPSKRFTFGLRSSSSTFSLSRSDRNYSNDVTVDDTGFNAGTRRRSPSVRKNKPSKIFGADIGGSRQDNYELKLIALREMGFPDDKRNLVILKGEGGNVDKAVATLIRLGEGNRMSSGESSLAPETPPKDEQSPAITGRSTNPFDKLDLQDKALPPPPIEDGIHQHAGYISTETAYNPFLQPSQTQLEQSFQGLTVSQPSSLFPNTTGGYINSQHMSNPFLQTYTPPPQLHATNGSQFATPPPFAPQTNFGPYQQPAPTGNPFMHSNAQPQNQSTNPFGMQQQNSYQAQYNATGHQTPQSSYNPSPNVYNPFPTPQTNPVFSPQHTSSPIYGQQITGASNPFLQTGMVQQYTQPPQGQFTPSGMVQSPLTQSPIQQTFGSNPFNSPYSQQGQQSHQQAQPQAQYQQHSQSIPAPMKFDKASILALYQLQAQDHIQTGVESQQAISESKRSVTMPLPATGLTDAQPAATSANPFMNLANAQSSNYSVPPVIQKPTNPALNRVGFGHVSTESADFSTMMNGRHSPDAFAKLSAQAFRPGVLDNR